jgi:addiction module HigA family antidote
MESEIIMEVIPIHQGASGGGIEGADMSVDGTGASLIMPTNRITQIMNGTRSVSGDTALRLAHFFGTSAQFWLNLQSLYDLRIAEQKAGKSIKSLPKLKRHELLHA